MSTPSYYVPTGGLPAQTELLSSKAVFKTAYAVIPSTVMTDIVTSLLPFWDKARFWVIARPMSGFAETFSHYIAELEPGGGSQQPESDPAAQAVLFVAAGTVSVSIAGNGHDLGPGGYAYIPPGSDWQVVNRASEPVTCHWIRKAYQPVAGLGQPDPVVGNEVDIAPSPMPGTQGRWSTTRFFDTDDLRFDMHVNIVNFEPGAVIPFLETHVMEHGLYVLEGKAVYRLNEDWVEVEAGDYMWLRAFCPQACYAGGPGRFRYLLYKDVNRHMPLSLGPS